MLFGWKAEYFDVSAERRGTGTTTKTYQSRYGSDAFTTVVAPAVAEKIINAWGASQ
ncbi:MAG: hypothetical protein ACI35P_06575 [Bacillus sp. (in: firmicutes)]